MTEETISEELLNILVCPECQVEVDIIQYQSGKNGLKCRKCQRVYPIEEGIPIMLVDEALFVKT
jgi:uncharacterized protein YbaR (Trm112 family)